MSVAQLTITQDGGTLKIACAGDWTIQNLNDILDQLSRLADATGQAARFEDGGIDRLDTAGAWAVHATRQSLLKARIAVDLGGLSTDHIALIDAVAANDRPCETEPPPEGSIHALLARVGAGVVDLGRETADLVGFMGQIIATIGRVIRHPSRFRATSFVYHLEQVGLNAVPIVCLMSFLIGIVLAYQGADQLRRFGAEVFVVNLLAVSVLREIAILMTAIIVAGRSGSAFTAQIGSMKVHEEVDAMRTLGLDPIEVLVLPRVLALVVALPLLGFLADMMGLLGGGLMAWVALDISPGMFLSRLKEAADVSHFWVGMVKAPFFAFTIAMIGCFEGLKVQGSAESVGRLTTKAVVEAIFLVIIIDAVFSIYFAAMGV